MSCLASCGVVALALLISTAYPLSLLFPLVHCLSTALGSGSPLYTVSFVVHAGIASLHFAHWESLSGLPGM